MSDNPPPGERRNPSGLSHSTEPQAEPPNTEPPPAADTEPTPISEQSLRLAEALIFASAQPVTARGLAQILPEDTDPETVLATVKQQYAGRGVELVEAGNGVMFRTAPDLAPRLRKVIQVPRKLPRVAMETLAIIAYHQPITRAEVETFRGASLAQQTLDSLLEAGLIGPKGRRETPGRPTLWGTTPTFLSQFGLTDLRELPRREDLLLEPPGPSAAPAEPPEPAENTAEAETTGQEPLPPEDTEC